MRVIMENQTSHDFWGRQNCSPPRTPIAHIAAECSQTLQAKMCNFKVHMTTTGQNEFGNEFLMQKVSINLKVVLHLHVNLEPN